MTPKLPNLVGWTNNECCSAPGELKQVKADINLVVKTFSSFRKQEEVPGTVQVTCNHLLMRP